MKWKIQSHPNFRKKTRNVQQFKFNQVLWKEASSFHIYAAKTCTLSWNMQMLNFQTKKVKTWRDIRGQPPPKKIVIAQKKGRGGGPCPNCMALNVFSSISSQTFYMLVGGNLCNARKRTFIFRVVVPNIIRGIEIDFAVNRKSKKIDTFLLYREDSWRRGGFSHAWTVTKKQSLSIHTM